MRTILTVASLLVMAIGCSSSDADGGAPKTPDTTTNPPPVDLASMRVVHASPDAPTIDIWIRGGQKPLVAGIKYGETSPYVDVPAGKHTLEVRAGDKVVHSLDGVGFLKGSKTTAVAAGLVDTNDVAQRLRIMPLAEAFAASDGASVRVVHASSDADSFAVDIGNDSLTRPEIASVETFRDSGAAGVALPAGKEMQVALISRGSPITAFTLPALPKGEVFAIAIGKQASTPRAADALSLLLVGSNGVLSHVKQNPFVWALHASPDAPALDIFAGEVELADNVAFGRMSSRLQLPPGTHTLDFFPHARGRTRPTTPPLTSQPTGALVAGQTYLATAKGFATAGTPPLRLGSIAEEFELKDPTRARLRVLHASPDAPAIDVTLNGVVLGSNLTFASATQGAGVDVAPGKNTLTVTEAGNASKVMGKFELAPSPGQTSLLVKAGAVDQTKGQRLRILVIDTADTRWSVTELQPLP